MTPNKDPSNLGSEFTSLPINEKAEGEPIIFPDTFENSRQFLVSTGRFLVYYKGHYTEKQVIGKFKKASIELVHRGEYFDNRVSLSEEFKKGDGVIFPRIGVAVLNNYPNQDQLSVFTTNNKLEGLIIEPERVVYAVDALSTEYLRGYHDAVKHLYKKSLEDDEGLDDENLPEAYPVFPISTADATWGLQLTNVVRSPYSGKGVKIAVLDTGFNLNHVDFQSRAISSLSTVERESVEDLNGHGTHCIGTALGPKTSNLGARYGIAYEAEIYAGKVLSNSGRGTDSDILDGIEWALENGCEIISMSLGAVVDPNEPDKFSTIFEEVAKNALEQGTIIIAAAGNSSQREKRVIAPVAHPANCPSILAVGAIDQNLNVCDFSNKGQIDISAPGLDVYSAWMAPELTETRSGTSMATPHVAGIAALWLEAYPNATSYQLWQLLIQNARRLSGGSDDLGAGLVQSPL